MSDHPDDAAPRLIGLDWGTSSLRAFLISDGRALELRHADAGIQSLAGTGAEGFERAFEAIAGDWCGRWPGLPVLACGMVGSAQGWLEVPYVDCPADAAAIAGGLRTLRTRTGASLHLVGGLRCIDAGGVPDVMRGEETRALGVLQHDAAWRRGVCLVLPGTHSKWVTVRDGRIASFGTWMTGELFAVLRQHSILGRLMPPPQDDAALAADAFERGLAQARRAAAAGDWLHALFSARTLGLAGTLVPEQLPDYLSGLLIGSELGAALGAAGPDLPVVLGGESALCRRYADALTRLGRAPVATLPNTAPEGLWALARAAGLVAP